MECIYRNIYRNSSLKVRLLTVQHVLQDVWLVFAHIFQACHCRHAGLSAPFCMPVCVCCTTKGAATAAHALCVQVHRFPVHNMQSKHEGTWEYQPNQPISHVTSLTVTDTPQVGLGIGGSQQATLFLSFFSLELQVVQIHEDEHNAACKLKLPSRNCISSLDTQQSRLWAGLMWL